MKRFLSVASILGLLVGTAGALQIYAPGAGLLPSAEQWGWRYYENAPAQEEEIFNVNGGALILNSPVDTAANIYDERYTVSLDDDATYFYSIAARLPEASRGFYFRISNGDRGAYFRVTPERVQYLDSSTQFRTFLENDGHYDATSFTPFKILFHTSSTQLATYDFYAGDQFLGSGTTYFTGLPNTLNFGDGGYSSHEYAEFGEIRFGPGTGDFVIPEPTVSVLVPAALCLIGSCSLLSRRRATRQSRA